MAKIHIYGDPILRKNATAITDFNGELKDFAEQMKSDMYKYDGIGLAAPQVGKSIRMAVVDTTGGEREPYILINPEIFYFSEDTVNYEEGCLSIPGITLKINRPGVISVRALNENGKDYTLEKIDGLFARAIQHETDHLNGILFVDRTSPVNRRLISGKLKKMAKSYRDT